MNDIETQQILITPIKPPIPIKKEIKRSVNYIVGGLLIYELIMILTVFIYSVVVTVYLMYTKYGIYETQGLTSELTNILQKTGVPYFITILWGIPLVLLYYWTIQPRKLKMLFATKRKISPKTFLFIFIVAMSGQALFTLITGGLELIFNQFDLSILKLLEDFTQSSTLSMFLYTSFLAPITEELLFRGVILQRLQKYGKLFAIIISAVLFGAFHGNLAQGIFATFIGIVFAYIAIEYSIKWSILLHIINNFVFCELYLIATKGFNQATQDNIALVMNSAFLLAAIFIVIHYRKQIRNYIVNEKMQKGFFRYAFTSCVMIIFLILQLISSIFSISSI